ncbi:MAG TPA: hypothetical protein VGM91_22365 [Conexibacter sp.]|jgi:acetyltransferase-like isoleucine patch superfamily enzyme
MDPFLARDVAELSAIRRARFALRLAWLRVRWGGRFQASGRAFVGRAVRFELLRGGLVVLGTDAWIAPGARIRADGGEVRIGPGSVIGDAAMILSTERITIGSGCLVGDRAALIDHTWRADDVERPVRLQGVVGAAVVLADGARVGAGAVVGPGAVVDGEVEVGAVVGGAALRAGAL